MKRSDGAQGIHDDFERAMMTMLGDQQLDRLALEADQLLEAAIKKAGPAAYRPFERTPYGSPKGRALHRTKKEYPTC